MYPSQQKVKISVILFLSEEKKTRIHKNVLVYTCYEFSSFFKRQKNEGFISCEIKKNAEFVCIELLEKHFTKTNNRKMS